MKKKRIASFITGRWRKDKITIRKDCGSERMKWK